MVYCPECARWIGDDRYCQYCGAAIGGEGGRSGPDAERSRYDREADRPRGRGPESPPEEPGGRPPESQERPPEEPRERPPEPQEHPPEEPRERPPESQERPPEQPPEHPPDGSRERGGGGEDGDPSSEYGVSVYWMGLQVVFWLYVLFLLIRVAGPAARALGLASEAGRASSELTGFVLAVLVIGVAVALFLGLFYAVFLYVSIHGTDVVVDSSVVVPGEFGAIATERGYAAGGQVPVEPDLFFPSEFAGLFYLVPPVLLLVGGYWQRQETGDLVAAVTKVVIGYAFMAVVTILPVTWVFNAFVADFVADFATTGVTDAAIRVRVTDLAVAHLLVAVVYPLVFGGIGAAAAELNDPSRASPAR